MEADPDRMDDGPAGTAGLMGRLVDLGRLARPKEWLKQVFVLMPAPFAIAAGAEPDWGVFALGIAACCLIASSVYALNDTLDADLDRRDPEKRARPVASGRTSPRTALVWSGLLLLAGLVLVLQTGSRPAAATLAVYFVVNVAYCLGVKHVPLVDVFALGSGYLLRVLLGTLLLNAEPSNWLLLCSSALALFLGLAKRRADVVLGSDAAHRPSLRGYSQGFLDQAIAITAGLAIFSYALYSMDAPVFVAGREFASLPFATFGILEYLRVVHTRDTGRSPVDVLLHSPALLVCGLGWLAASLWSIGWPY